MFGSSSSSSSSRSIGQSRSTAHSSLHPALVDLEAPSPTQVIRPAVMPPHRPFPSPPFQGRHAPVLHTCMYPRHPPCPNLREHRLGTYMYGMLWCDLPRVPRRHQTIPISNAQMVVVPAQISSPSKCMYVRSMYVCMDVSKKSAPVSLM